MLTWCHLSFATKQCHVVCLVNSTNLTAYFGKIIWLVRSNFVSLMSLIVSTLSSIVTYQQYISYFHIEEMFYLDQCWFSLYCPALIRCMSKLLYYSQSKTMQKLHIILHPAETYVKTSKVDNLEIQWGVKHLHLSKGSVQEPSIRLLERMCTYFNFHLNIKSQCIADNGSCCTPANNTLVESKDSYPFDQSQLVTAVPICVFVTII